MYRIVYVDDEPRLLEIGKLFLESSGEFAVTTMTSAQEAMACPDILLFDAIIADYQMPEMDGITFLKRIREKDKDIPFILFTGRGREEVVIEAINSGADFYLQKGGLPRAQFTELAHKIRIAIERREAIDAVRDSERRLTEIINFLPDATFAIDTKGRVIAWNRALEQISGTAAADIIGRGDYEAGRAFYKKKRPMLADLALHADSPFEEKHYSYTSRSDATLTAETIASGSGDADRYFWGIAGRLFNAQGECTGAIESIRDITGRKASENELRTAYEQISAAGEELRGQYEELAQSEQKIRESEEQFRSIFNEAPYAIAISETLDGKYVSVNARFEQGIGLAASEILGKTPFDLGLLSRDDYKQLFAEFARHGRIDLAPLAITTRDGRQASLLVSVVPISLNNRAFVLTTIIDITESKRIEEALHKKEEQLTEIAGTLPGVVYQFYARPDGSMGIAYTSGRLSEIFGIGDAMENLLERFTERVDPRDREEFLASVSTAVKAEKSWSYEGRFVKPSGETIWFSGSSRPVRHGDDLVYSGIFQDISGRKNAEVELHEAYEQLAAANEELRSQYDEITRNEREKEESESRFRRLISQSFDAVVLHREGKIVLANQSAARILKAGSPEDLAGRQVQDFVHPLSRAKITERIRHMLESAEGTVPLAEEKFLGMDGTPVDVEVMATATQHEGKPAVLVVFRDITERKRIEEELFGSQQMLQNVLDTIPQRVFWKDKNSVFLGCNTPLARDLGFPDSSALIGKTDYDSTSKATADRYRADDRQVMETGVPRMNYEEPQVRPDGSRAWLRTSKIPLKHKNGETFGVLGIYEDVTDRRLAEEALRESEERYRRIVETANEGIWILDRELRIVFSNPRLAGIIGYTHEEMAGHAVLEFVSAEDRALVQDQFALRKEGKKSRYECRLLHRDGSTLWCLISGSPLFDRAGAFQGSFWMVTDISERKRAEDALRVVNNRLNLLSGITRHDIRNQLLILSGYLELSRQMLDNPEKIREFIEKETKIAETIALQIGFTRDYEELGKKVPEWQDVSRLVSHVVTQVSLEQIRVENGIAGIEVYADPMLEKVFYNLIDNALRYGGSRMTAIRFSCRKAEQGIVLVIADDGDGIPAREKSLIFGQGYGKNTGLGLFLSREILAITGLTIQETGTEGKGACFEIAVPPGSWRTVAGEK